VLNLINIPLCNSNFPPTILYVSKVNTIIVSTIWIPMHIIFKVIHPNSFSNSNIVIPLHSFFSISSLLSSTEHDSPATHIHLLPPWPPPNTTPSTTQFRRRIRRGSRSSTKHIIDVPDITSPLWFYYPFLNL